MNDHKWKELVETQELNERGVIYGFAFHSKRPYIVYGLLTPKLSTSAMNMVSRGIGKKPG